MRPDAERRIVDHLAAGGLNACQIADIAALPRTTVRDWLRSPARRARPREQTSLELESLPNAAYSYLLGFYLGDGCLSRGRREVYRLRIKTDARYPGIIAECAAAMQAVMPENRVSIQKMPYRAVEIGCSSKRWPLLFPQHGPGRKHERRIVLEDWRSRSSRATQASSCAD